MSTPTTGRLFGGNEGIGCRVMQPIVVKSIEIAAPARDEKSGLKSDDQHRDTYLQSL
jgi:hypothetical protein